VYLLTCGVWVIKRLNRGLVQGSRGKKTRGRSVSRLEPQSVDNLGRGREGEVLLSLACGSVVREKTGLWTRLLGTGYAFLAEGSWGKVKEASTRSWEKDLMEKELLSLTKEKKSEDKVKRGCDSFFPGWVGGNSIFGRAEQKRGLQRSRS